MLLKLAKDARFTVPPKGAAAAAGVTPGGQSVSGCCRLLP
jgi:hypothetical protein